MIVFDVFQVNRAIKDVIFLRCCSSPIVRSGTPNPPSSFNSFFAVVLLYPFRSLSRFRILPQRISFQFSPFASYAFPIWTGTQSNRKKSRRSFDLSQKGVCYSSRYQAEQHIVDWWLPSCERSHIVKSITLDCFHRFFFRNSQTSVLPLNFPVKMPLRLLSADPRIMLLRMWRSVMIIDSIFLCSSMFPSEIVSREPYTYLVDLWSLGCLFAHCLTGNPIFDVSASVNLMIIHCLDSTTGSFPEWDIRQCPH